MSMHKMRTRVDKDGVPYIIQWARAGNPAVFNFKLFNGEYVVLTYELVEYKMRPLPELFIHNLVREENYNSINELLGDWVWNLYKSGTYRGKYWKI